MRRAMEAHHLGVKTAQGLLSRLGWGWDASCFGATAPPEMLDEALRVHWEPEEQAAERAFRWYLGLDTSWPERN